MRLLATKQLQSLQGTIMISLHCSTRSDFYSNAQFVKCDVRNWDDQVRLFEAAIAKSPHMSCDVVIANAGVIAADDVSTLQGTF
jgi:NAD(P)-dependent dehydrogenase (short-subunit alcohol dehydrogenase family)